MRPGAKALAGLAGALLLAAAGCMPEEESRGTWRTVSWSRPAALADTLPLSANVTYKAGHFTIRAASAPVLYTANLTFDADVQEQPSHSFDPDTRELYVGLGRGSVNMPDGAGASEGRLRLSLSRTVPLHLQTRLAGTASDLDLTGMRLERAQVMSSMSDVRVHMDEPNAAHGTVIRLDNRYGRMVAVRLANANADTITVNSDFGAVDLDFSGRWTRNVVLELEATVGDVKLRVPTGVGVEVQLDDRWGGAPDSWSRDGNRSVSPGWEGAQYRLSVRGRKTVARLSVVGG